MSTQMPKPGKSDARTCNYEFKISGVADAGDMAVATSYSSLCQRVLHSRTVCPQAQEGGCFAQPVAMFKHEAQYIRKFVDRLAAST